jgi:hypothetical protein
MGQTPSVEALMKVSERCCAPFSHNRREPLIAAPVPAPTLGGNPNLESVTSFFEKLKHTEILEFCLGYDRPDAPALAEHVVVIALECGFLTQNSSSLLDIGLHEIQRNQMRDHLSSPGPHSANLLKNIAYYHLRMQHNAHFANCLPNPNDLEDNHFGITRFVDEEEAKKILDDSFVKRIKSEPEPLMYDPIRDEYVTLESSKCEFRPIVLLGFCEPQIQRLYDTLRFCPSILKNVVATISAQTIARDQGFDWRGNIITLPQLSNDLGIDNLESKTAADHAAHTLIDVIQMVMRPKIPLAKESIRSVINSTMLHSQSHEPPWGKVNLCTQCGEGDHRRRACDVIK